MTPTDTMIPVAPARVSASPLVWPRKVTIEYMSAPETANPSHTTRPSAR